MASVPPTYSTLSAAEQEVYAAVSVPGTTSSRPEGVGILSSTPTIEDLTAGGMFRTVASGGPSNIIAAMEEV